MKKIFTKLLAVLLAICMVVTLFPLSAFAEEGGHEDSPPPGENQFKIWWDDYIPEGGVRAAAKYIIGSGSEEAAQMNVLVDIEAGASLTFIYTPAEDDIGNPEPFWGLEICFEGSEPEFIAKEDLTEESGTYYFTVDRSENSAGLNVGALRNDPQGDQEDSPAPGDNQFRICWDDYIPEGGIEAVAKYIIGSGSEEAAQMNVLVDIEAGASLTFIYTPATDDIGNPEPFWGLEICFEGSEPEFIAKEDLTEESGTYYFTVDRSENSAGLNVGALRNDPQGDQEDSPAPGDNQFKIWWDDYIPEDGVRAVAKYIIGSGSEETAQMNVLVDIEAGASLTFIYTPAEDDIGNPEPFWGLEICFEGSEPEFIAKEDLTEESGTYYFTVDRSENSAGLNVGALRNDPQGDQEDSPAPGDNQFKIWWDDYIPEGGVRAAAKYIIGSGSEETAQMNVLVDIEEGASLTFIYTPAEDGSGNPEPFWGLEVCFEGSEPEFIPKEDLTEESGTFYFTVDRSENSAGLNVGALRNDPQGGFVPGDVELDADFTGGGHYEGINTNEFTWTVPAGEENKLIVRNTITVGEGGGLIGTDETSVLEIQTTANVKGVQLYDADGTTEMNDITTGELSGVEGFGQWAAFGWNSGKWVLLNGPHCEHSFTNYISNNDATCQANCTETASCDNGCGATNTREIPNSKNFDNHLLTTFTYTSNGDGTHTKKHECCGTEAETENCSGGRATCTKKAVCSVCNAEYGKLAAHEHDSEWKSDETGHWRECVCGDKGTVTAHTPDKSAPTATEPVKCTICDYIIAPATGVTQPEVIRFGGDTRIETALLISGNWESADNVVLANGRSYADALAGVPLAYALNAPILLIEGESIDSSIMERIAELGAKNVYLLGGEVAISSAAEKQLTDGKYTVERIAGDSRFGTAVEIANKLKSISGGAPESVFFANGYNYPDALAVSSAAALQGKPVLYAQQSEPLDDVTRAFITENNITDAIVLGGEVAIGAEVYNDINSICTNLERINGSDRYETAAEIIGKFGSTFAGKGIAIATGLNYPDALAGAAFAAKQGLAVMLVPDELDEDSRTEMLKQLISAETETVYVFGGQGAVSDAVIDTLLD